MLETYNIVLLIGTTLWVLMAIIYFRSGIASVYHPLTYYFLFHGLVFVFRPWFQYNNHLMHVYNLYGFYPTLETKVLAQVLTWVGLAVFASSVLIFGNVKRAPFIYLDWSNHPDNLRRLKRSVLIAFFLFSPIIFYSMKYGYSINFGEEDLRRLSRDEATFHTIYTDTSAYVVDANIMLGSFSVLIAYFFRFNFFSLLPFVVFFIFRMTVGWSRYTFILISVSLALVYLHDRHAKWPRGWIIAFACVIIVVFSSLSHQRDYVASYFSGRDLNTSYIGNDRKFLDNLDFANIEFLEYLVHVIPDRTGGYDFFANTLEIFTAPIPRVFWPSKPVGPPIKTFNINDYGFPVGITFSIVGEGWRSLGGVGVVIWSLFAGFVWGISYKYFIVHIHSVFTRMWYFLFLPIAIQWFRDGVLLSLVKFPLFFLLPVFGTYIVYICIRSWDLRRRPIVR